MGIICWGIYFENKGLSTQSLVYVYGIVINFLIQKNIIIINLITACPNSNYLHWSTLRLTESYECYLAFDFGNNGCGFNSNPNELGFKWVMTMGCCACSPLSSQLLRSFIWAIKKNSRLYKRNESLFILFYAIIEVQFHFKF